MLLALAGQGAVVLVVCGCRVVVLRGRFPLSGRTALKPILLSWPQLPFCAISKGGTKAKYRE